jgi:hypothetical protein
MKRQSVVLAALLALLAPPALLARSASDGPGAGPTQSATGPGNSDTRTAAGGSLAVGPAVFPHDEHAQEMGIECVNCHHETNATPLSLPHKDYFADFWIRCSTCHHDSGTGALAPKSCSTCHHSRHEDIADQTLSAKVVIHKTCWSCHSVGTGAEASSSCTHCHPDGS